MILNPVIQQKLAAAFGHELRYPSDFEALAMDIAERTGQGFSVNTLKRLCGLIGPEVQPRLGVQRLDRWAGTYPSTFRMSASEAAGAASRMRAARRS